MEQPNLSELLRGVASELAKEGGVALGSEVVKEALPAVAADYLTGFVADLAGAAARETIGWLVGPILSALIKSASDTGGRVRRLEKRVGSLESALDQRVLIAQKRVRDQVLEVIAQESSRDGESLSYAQSALHSSVQLLELERANVRTKQASADLDFSFDLLHGIAAAVLPGGGQARSKHLSLCAATVHREMAPLQRQADQLSRVIANEQKARGEQAARRFALYAASNDVDSSRPISSTPFKPSNIGTHRPSGPEKPSWSSRYAGSTQFDHPNTYWMKHTLGQANTKQRLPAEFPHQSWSPKTSQRMPMRPPTLPDTISFRQAMAQSDLVRVTDELVKLQRLDAWIGALLNYSRPAAKAVRGRSEKSSGKRKVERGRAG